MLRRFRNFISTPKGLSIVNTVLLVLVILTNLLFQAFCRPTEWATILLIICFLNVALYPLITEQTKLFYVSNFINGLSFGIFVYCIIFLEHINFLGLFAILLFGLGLVTFIPYFFVIQLFYKLLFGYKNVLTKILFCLGILTFLSVAFVFNSQYKTALVSIDNFKKSNFTTLDKNFMTEKILGMYFKYHTQICEYDGWRPPLHEPALVIGQWLNGRQDPLSPDRHSRLDLKERINLYRSFFPDEKVKLNCSCASGYSSDYHNDSLFKTP